MNRFVVIVVGFLLFVLITIVIVLNVLNRKNSQPLPPESSIIPTPTTFPLSRIKTPSPTLTSLIDSLQQQPVDMPTFNAYYSPQLDQVVIVKKTPDADEGINDWISPFNLNVEDIESIRFIDQTAQASLSEDQQSRIESFRQSLPLSTESLNVSEDKEGGFFIIDDFSENPDSTAEQINNLAQDYSLEDVVGDPNLFVVNSPVSPTAQKPSPFPTFPASSTTPSPGEQNLLKYMTNVFQIVFGSPNQTPHISLTPTAPPSSVPVSNVKLTPPNRPPGPAGLVYYRQCDYSGTPMGGGCSLCNSGCGITAVAMALSTRDPSLDPPHVLQLYQAYGQYAGCDGSYIQSAKMVLERQGFQTSDYIFRYSKGGGATIDKVGDEMRAYLKNGWKIFVLADFCKRGCMGHFFWITDIDENNIPNAWSYDPAYVPRGQAPPVNHTLRYTDPLYRTAFAVKL